MTLEIVSRHMSGRLFRNCRIPPHRRSNNISRHKTNEENSGDLNRHDLLSHNLRSNYGQDRYRKTHDRSDRSNSAQSHKILETSRISRSDRSDNEDRYPQQQFCPAASITPFRLYRIDKGSPDHLAFNDRERFDHEPGIVLRKFAKGQPI